MRYSGNSYWCDAAAAGIILSLSCIYHWREAALSSLSLSLFLSFSLSLSLSLVFKLSPAQSGHKFGGGEKREQFIAELILVCCLFLRISI
jgi:hypothetical protein